MSRILPITPMLMRGLGAGPALVTTGLGPIIGDLIRILRGGRSVIRDAYGDKLEEFKIAVALVSINGKELLDPILNKGKYVINESDETSIKVKADRVEKRRNRLFEVFAKALNVRRGSDGND